MRFKLLKEDVSLLIKGFLDRDIKVIGTMKKQDQYVFTQIHDPDAFTANYVPTILPLKKYFIPQRETLLHYDKKQEMFENPDILEHEKQLTIYMGIRGCDFESIKILDEMMLTNETDLYYHARRKNSLFFVFDCEKPVDKDCFCYMLHKKDMTGADAVFYDHGSYYLLEILHETAIKILSPMIDILQKTNEKIPNQGMDTDDYDWLMNRQEDLMDDHKVEKVCREEAEQCLDCGSCVMVCPTCYCFTIQDEDDVNMAKGKRVRAWDGCMLTDFSLVAGGHHLVSNGVERAIHRFSRKYKNALKHHDRFLCVGCGRCSRVCPAKNNIKTMLKSL
ncbi:4Fe-4S dicluster domain-containing protein [Vallitalea pronyensis]|uniref:4Fe-4S dicluster domain-containing protein n=1 Tax=Vallitalea pronyensis TaxID=1348613 RepID=A0A8J8MNM0_9FIRM|nr:4Fe-4S dicluster domain-containing protein [Vallitalea pronyensis]QUI24528.1 4Fe-4S dicluster domain-containing protein [Vallitalea pronyensis]